MSFLLSLSLLVQLFMYTMLLTVFISHLEYVLHIYKTNYVSAKFLLSLSFTRHECDFRICFPSNFLRLSHRLSIVLSAPFCKITSLSTQAFLMPYFAQTTWLLTNRSQTNTGYCIWCRLSCRSSRHVVNFLCWLQPQDFLYFHNLFRYWHQSCIGLQLGLSFAFLDFWAMST